MNPQEICSAAERSEQATRAGGIKVNASSDERGNISASLDNDEFRRDPFFVKVTIGPGYINRDKRQGIVGLSDPNRGLCTLGEIWCKEQRNEKQTAQRFGLPRFASKALSDTFLVFVE